MKKSIRVQWNEVKDEEERKRKRRIFQRDLLCQWPLIPSSPLCASLSSSVSTSYSCSSLPSTFASTSFLPTSFLPVQPLPQKSKRRGKCSCCNAIGKTKLYCGQNKNHPCFICSVPQESGNIETYPVSKIETENKNMLQLLKTNLIDNLLHGIWSSKGSRRPSTMATKRQISVPISDPYIYQIALWPIGIKQEKMVNLKTLFVINVYLILYLEKIGTIVLDFTLHDHV